MASQSRSIYDHDFAYPTSREHPAPFAALRRISWGAVFAGIAVVLALQLLLTLLGIGIGLASLDPAGGDTPRATELGMGGGIWALIVTGVSVLAGAWVAGRLAGSPTRTDGLLHGVVTWAAAVLLAVYLLTSAVGSVLGTAFGTLGGTVQALGQGTQSLASGAMEVLPDDVLARAERLFERAPEAAAQAQQQLQQAADTTDPAEAVERVVAGVQEGASPQERDAAIDLIARQAGLSREQAEQRLDEFQAGYRQLAQQAREGAAAAAEAAAFAAFVALLVGLVLAAVGGAVGTPRRLHTAD